MGRFYICVICGINDKGTNGSIPVGWGPLSKENPDMAICKKCKEGKEMVKEIKAILKKYEAKLCAEDMGECSPPRLIIERVEGNNIPLGTEIEGQE